MKTQTMLIAAAAGVAGFFFLRSRGGASKGLGQESGGTERGEMSGGGGQAPSGQSPVYSQPAGPAYTPPSADQAAATSQQVQQSNLPSTPAAPPAGHRVTLEPVPVTYSSQRHQAYVGIGSPPPPTIVRNR